MAKVATAQYAQFEIKSLGPLDLHHLQPKTDFTGVTEAIKALWDALNAQQEMSSNLAAELQNQKEDSARQMGDMKDELYGIIEKLKQDLSKSNEDNRQMNNALKDLIHATDKETKQAIEDSENKINDKVSDLQQQVTHNAHVANTALERAVDAKQLAEENQGALNDLDDRVSADLHRLTRTVGLSKSETKKAVENGNEKDTMLKTPALAHILELISEKEGGGGSGTGGGAMTSEDREALEDVRNRVERLEKKHHDLAKELHEADRGLGNRIDRLESHVKSREASELPELPTGTSSGGNMGSKDVEAINQALQKLRTDVAHIRSALDSLGKELSKKADQDLVDKLADAHAGLAQRVATLEGTLNDTRGNVDEALRIARQALKAAQAATNQLGGSQRGPQHQSSGADAQAVMMLRDALDGLANRVAALEREVNEVDAKKASHDDLNRALQDVLKAMEQAIAQLYDELKKQLAAIPNGGGAADDDENSTTARFRCLSCNRRAGPLQEKYHEKMSKSLLPPGDTLATPRGITPPRTSPPRAPQVPGVRDGFDPRPLTSSRRKLQTYYDWLHTKGAGFPNQGGESNLSNGLVGKTFTRGGVDGLGGGNIQQQQPQKRELSPSPEQQAHDRMVTSARISYAELPPARHESPNPATSVGIDGKHYAGVFNRNQGSQLKPSSIQQTGNNNNNSNSLPKVNATSAASAAAGGGGGNATNIPSRPGTATNTRRY